MIPLGSQKRARSEKAEGSLKGFSVRRSLLKAFLQGLPRSGFPQFRPSWYDDDDDDDDDDDERGWMMDDGRWTLDDG